MKTTTWWTRYWLIWFALSMITLGGIVALTVSAARADTFPDGYTTGSETYPHVCGPYPTDAKGCGPVPWARVLDCDTVEFDPPFVVKVTLHYYDEGATDQYAFEVVDYDGTGSTLVTHATDLLNGHTGHVDLTWNVGSGVISDEFDCATPPTTEPTTVPPTTTPPTTAPPVTTTPTTQKTVVVPPTQVTSPPHDTNHLTVPEAGPAPITETPATLAFTGMAQIGLLLAAASACLALGLGLARKFRVVGR